MKKILIVLVALLLASCSNQSPLKEEVGDSLNIVTTIYPMTELVNMVVKDDGQVTQLIPNTGADGHTWEPSPQDIVKIEQADVFVYNGAGMESWVDTVLDSISNKNLVVINASEEIDLIEGHNHDHDHDDDHDEEHDHDHEEDHDHDHEEDKHEHEEDHEHDHQHEGGDPHTWSTPLNAIEQLEHIEDELSSHFPQFEENFEKNTEEGIVIFNDLHKQYEEGLKDISNRILVVQHEAFGYLAHQYDLEQVGIEGLVPTSEPDPARMVEIIELVKNRGVKTIFFEENVSDKVANTIASETGAKTATLNTLAVQNSDKMSFVDMMKQNLDTLIEGLK